MTKMQEFNETEKEQNYEEVSQQCIISCARLISSLYNGSRDKITEALADAEGSIDELSRLLRRGGQEGENFRPETAGECNHAADGGK